GHSLPLQKSQSYIVGVAQAKPLLFQVLFASERCYLALKPHFPYLNVRHKAVNLSKNIQTVRHGDRAMLCSEAQFFSFAQQILRCGPLLILTSDRLVSRRLTV